MTGYFSVGLSAVSVLRVCLLVKATYFSYVVVVVVVAAYFSRKQGGCCAHLCI